MKLHVKPMPTLAIIVNCYNYENFVGRAITSVVSQDLRHCEFIVVDDGSTDDSWSTICSTGARAVRKENGGQISACLYGLDRTSAPFVLFLDADDELLPGSIDTIIKHLDCSVAKLQYPLAIIDESGAATGHTFPSLSAGRERGAYVDKVQQTGLYISPPTSGNVFRRDVCEILRSADYDSAVDGAILFIAPFFGDIVTLDKPQGYYRVHGSNKSGVNGAVNANLILRQRDRFTGRVNHIKNVLTGMGLADLIKDPKEMYFYRRCELYLALLSKQRLNIGLIIDIIYKFPDDYSITRRIVSAVILGIAYLLPKEAGCFIAETRYSSSRRPIFRLKSIRQAFDFRRQ
ncbi:glycosyltransferase family 2 protein [Methylobacterium sp. NEAU K]|uniref:glycosyltransferase family 2 protein n=1 Tax=Methylobacterium sp. NEAU K TaxID=3064946 RepID=UPI0027375B2B|nr:glycosyltransferase family 2 protein [Methylobacterium sp. NEAU K]MDP4005276.1 glycosyltransferase family 2 protein [Methylobacterium sp. NEAU K]